MSRVLRKSAFCICENKDADQLHGNCEADQHLCFRYTDTTIPLLPKSEISSLQPSSVAVQPGLCRTLSETPKTGFLRTRLIYRKVPKSSDAKKLCSNLPKIQTKKPNLRVFRQNQRTNGPVNAHLISWPSKAQNKQNLENIW